MFTSQAPQEQLFPIAGTEGKWVVNALDRTGHAKHAVFLGRDALWLRAGTHVIRTDSNLVDGTIEFDLAPMDHGDFVAVVFRRESFGDHENVYLRLRRSEQYMALQYAPRVGGSSTWQLYPEFNTTVAWPRNQWTHVRLEVRGSGLEVFVGDAAEPALTVPRLRSSARGSQIALWARVNDKPDVWAAAISNLQIRPAASRAAARAAEAPPSGFVAEWEVAGPVAATAGITSLPEPGLSWKKLPAEESGLVNVNRIIRQQRGKFVAFGRVKLRAEVAQRIAAGIGYSDDVTVFINGVPIFSGQNGWESRMPDFASFVDARFEKAWLPLRAGDNEIVLAVTDDQRFGWGFAMRLDTLPGIRLWPDGARN